MQEREALENKITVTFEENACRSAAYIDGKPAGECEFEASDGVWTITHTGVRPEYGGRGIAGMLLEKVIEAARAKQVKIVPLCSYAAKKMEGKEEYADVLRGSF